MEPDWWDDAPLFAAWRRFVHADVAPFTVPGHKRRGGDLHPDLGRLLDADVPLYGGADTLKLATGVLREAEVRAAALWGADHCRFSTGGSTQANQIVCLSLGAPGDEVLVGRNAHRSVLSGLVLAGLVPVWLPVEVHPATGAPLGVAPTDVRTALRDHPDAVAVLVTDPSYQGTVGELAGVVRAGHDHGVPVVVDQAWGAHFGMAEGMPPHALELGADALVTSAHKMLPAYSQAALVAAQGARIDLDRLDRAVAALETTSPTSAILASIDASRAFLGSPEGRAAISRTATLVADARERLAGMGLLAPGAQTYGAGRVDPLKLVIHLAAAGRDGIAIENALLELGIPVEMADRDALVAQVGLLDDATTLERLLDGIASATAGPAGSARALAAAGGDRVPPRRLTPRAAYFAEYDVVDLDAAVGRVSAELVAPYPPGVPLLVPGEEVTPGTLQALHTAVEAGTRIAYAADPGLATLHVVREP